MGCCNKELTGEPIGRVRYWGGTALIAGVHLGLLGALTVAAPFLPRARRALPFYRAFTRDTLGGILRRERIQVAGRGDGAEACRPEGLGA